MIADRWGGLLGPESAVRKGSIPNSVAGIDGHCCRRSFDGFESGGLAIAHSVHNGLTTAPGTHEYLHGEKVAFGLLVQLIVEERPQEEIDEVLAFSRSVGLPVTLAEVGIVSLDSSMLSAIATRSVAEGETAHHEPFAVTASMIEKGIIAADSLGRRQG